jgi:hypothetical protein
MATGMHTLVLCEAEEWLTSEDATTWSMPCHGI